MVIGFKKQFPQKILDGVKIHTIRVDGHDRWHKGRKIHFATGVRTKHYAQFMDGECISVEYIRVRWTTKGPCVSIGDIKAYIPMLWIHFYMAGVYGEDQMRRMAVNDGFDTIDEFFKWFNTDFDGKIIHWTDHRYTDKDLGIYRSTTRES